MKKVKSMHEKLKEDYQRSVENRTGGHMIGFYNETCEEIKGMYRFEKGLYTLRKKNGNFFWWDYGAEAKKKEKISGKGKRRGLFLLGMLVVSLIQGCAYQKEYSNITVNKNEVPSFFHASYNPKVRGAVLGSYSDYLKDREK